MTANAFQRPGSRPHQPTRLVIGEGDDMDDLEASGAWLSIATDDAEPIRP